MRISWPKFLILIAMSAVGIIASSIVIYLFDTLHEQLPVCSSSQTFLGIRIDCNAVLASQYNNVFGINLDVLAVGYFVVSMALVCFLVFGSDWLYRKSFRALFAWRFLGLLIVPYLMFVEFGILRTICVYCTIMHVAILVDFVIISYFLFFGKDIRSFAQSGTAVPPVA